MRSMFKLEMLLPMALIFALGCSEAPSVDPIDGEDSKLDPSDKGNIPNGGSIGGGGGGGTTPPADDEGSDFQDSLTGTADTPNYYVGSNPLASNIAWGKQAGVDPRTMGIYNQDQFGFPTWAAEGGRIGFGAAGLVDDNCMNNAIQEHNKNLKSNDLTVRNEARAKQFNINKTKNMKSLMSLGARGGKSVLKLGRTWGIELEPIFEGAFYEYARRKGYTHEQAKEETFFWKMF